MIKSTKPFRRVGQLISANIYLFFIGIYVATARKVASWTHSEFYIDKLQNPLLYRAYYINRSRPAELRQKEFEEREKMYQIRVANREVEIGRQITTAVMKKQTPHQELAASWDWDFHEDDRAKAAEEARLNAEAAKKAEEERQRRFAEERQKEIEAERAHALDELKRREHLYHVVNNTRQDFPSPVRAVGVHEVTIRNLPSTECRAIAQKTTGAVITVDGWVYSEVHYSNGVWFRMIKSREFPEGGWVWSGAFSNQSVQGLRDLNETPDSFVTKTADGSVVQEWTAPTDLECQIANEIERLKQTTRLSDGMITASFISAGKIRADRINIGSKSLEVTRSGHTTQIPVPTGFSKAPSISQNEIEAMKKVKRDYDKKSRELNEAKAQLKRQKEQHETEQRNAQMWSTVNSAISQMNYSSSHSSD